MRINIAKKLEVLQIVLESYINNQMANLLVVVREASLFSVSKLDTLDHEIVEAEFRVTKNIILKEI